MSTPVEFVSAAREWNYLTMHSSMGGFFHYARELGLSPMHLGALMKMGRGGASRVAELGVDFGVTTAAASQMLERLAAMGLVTRLEDPRDRRAKRVELTKLGVKTVAKATQARHGWLERVASGMTREELDKACEVLSMLVERAREIEAEEQNR